MGSNVINSSENVMFYMNLLYYQTNLDNISDIQQNNTKIRQEFKNSDKLCENMNLLKCCYSDNQIDFLNIAFGSCCSSQLVGGGL